MNNLKQKVSIAAIALMVFIGGNAYSQGQFFGGIDVGVLSDRNHFISETGQTLSGGTIGGLLSASFGFRKNDYVIATGFGRYSHGLRTFELDRNTGIFERPNQSGTAVQSYVIPVTFAREFQVYKKWHLGVGVGLLGLIARDVGYRGKTGNYGFDPDPADPSSVIRNADSTITTFGTNRNFNMAFETSLYMVYRIVDGAEFFAKASYQGHINPNFTAEHTFYSEAGTVRGSSLAINSFVVGIGMRYYFRRAEE